MSEQHAFKAGYVALVGEPNVGKSTLMNSLLNQKISIVTSKPQTTRQRVLGILSKQEAQIIFLDTPGLLRPHYLLQEKMLRFAELALADADLIVLLTEVSRGTELPPIVKEIVQREAARHEKPMILAINKVDTLPRDHLLPLIADFSSEHLFKEIVPLSALKQENLEDFLSTIIKYLPVHPPFYPSDIVSEQPERFFVAELIREKIFEEYRDEVPYSTAVDIREYRERDEGKTYIDADIIVERDSQKGILIGKRGGALKKIGQRARTDIEQFIERPVFLALHVKVRGKWRKDDNWLRRLGYTTD